MIVIMAWRNIWRNKLRSFVIMMSVALGLFSGMLVLALYKGMMHSRIRTVIDAETGNIQLHDPGFKKDYEPVFIIKNSAGIIEELKKDPGIQFITGRTITQGMLATSTGSAGVQVNGIIPEQEDQVSQLNKKLILGKEFNPGKKNEILIGKKLADKMKLKTGNKLVLTFTDSSSNIISGAFRVAGIYQSANAPLDERNVYIRQEELNELLGIGNNLHEIVIKLKDDDETDIVKEKLKQNYRGQLVESWKDISPETNLMVETVDIYSYIIIVIILFALAFGIINTMLMAVLERTREIGMMTALGMNKIRMFLLILSETVFLSIAGTPVGLICSWLLCNYYNKRGIDWSGFGKEMMSSFGFNTMIYPEYPVEKIIPVMLIVTGTAILSCLFPAVKALRLQPVDALRK